MARMTGRWSFFPVCVTQRFNEGRHNRFSSAIVFANRRPYRVLLLWPWQRFFVRPRGGFQDKERAAG